MEHSEPTGEPEVAPASAEYALATPGLVSTPAVTLTHAVVAGDPRGALDRAAAAPPHLRGAMLARLQQGAGNQAVSRAMLARQGEGGAPQGNAPHGGQHGSGSTLDVGTLEDHEKIDALPASIAAGEAITVSGLWTSHSGWPGVARKHATLFESSIELCPDLLDSFTDEQEAFKSAVEGTARNHLEENKQYVTEEMAKLGIDTGMTFDSTGTPEDQAKRVGEVKALAVEAQRALRAKQDLQGIKVGINGSEVDQGASNAPPAFSTVTFNPDVKPQQPGDPDEGFRTWDEVSTQWNELEATIAHLEATSPALFAVINAEGVEGDSAKAEEAGALASSDDETAVAKMESAMTALNTKLDDVWNGIGSDYEWDDLGMLFPQVLAAEPWTNAIDNAIAKRLIKENADTAEALDNALTAVGILAAVVAVFATGGMALALTAVGAAAGGTQAVMSVDDYAKKQALRGARTGDKQHDLIAQETVDAAAVKAIIDTVFAFIDLVGAGKAIKAAGAVDDVAAKLGKLADLAGAEKEATFKTALDVMGTPKALDSVGGLDAARAQLGAGSASLTRAEAYSTQLVEEMGQSLGGKEARERAAKQLATPDLPPAGPGAAPAPVPAPAVKPPEDLLKQAQEFAAAKTGLPADRALKVVAPAADSLDEITLVMQRGLAAAGEMSDEYATLATKEARAAKVHEKAVAWGQERKLPAMGSEIAEDGPYFSPQRWTIVYNSADLSAKEASHATWEFLQATGIHEMRHVQQWVDMARVAMGKGMSEADIIAKLEIHAEGLKAARAAGPLSASDPAFAKANQWYESVAGAGADARRKVLTELQAHRAAARNLDAAWKKTTDLQAKINALPAGSPERVALEKEFGTAKIDAMKQQKLWERNTAAREANDAAYQRLPEEVDAYNVQREYGEMLQSKRNAEEAAKRARDQEIELDESDFIDDTDEIELDESDFVEVSTP